MLSSDQKNALTKLWASGTEGLSASELRSPFDCHNMVDQLIRSLRDKGKIVTYTSGDGSTKYVASDPRNESCVRKMILEVLRSSKASPMSADDIASKASSDGTSAEFRHYLSAMVKEGSVFQRHGGLYVAAVDPQQFLGGYYDEPTDALPIHFQPEDTRQEVKSTLDVMAMIPKSFNVQVNSSISTLVEKASLPLAVTVSSRATTSAVSVGESKKPWLDVLQRTQAPLSLKIESSDVDASRLQPLVGLTANTEDLSIAVWGDAALKTVATLVKEPMCVQCLTLEVSRSTQLSHTAFSEMLDALCSIPELSRLKRCTIPAALRMAVKGDPLVPARAIFKLENNARASAVVRWDEGEESEQAVSTPPCAEKGLDLWLTCDAHHEFDAARAVTFPREALKAASPVVRGMLGDSPEEERIPLPMDSLQVRSVSLDALRVVAALVNAVALRGASNPGQAIRPSVVEGVPGGVQHGRAATGIWVWRAPVPPAAAAEAVR